MALGRRVGLAFRGVGGRGGTEIPLHWQLSGFRALGFRVLGV